MAACAGQEVQEALVVHAPNATSALLPCCVLVRIVRCIPVLSCVAAQWAKWAASGAVRHAQPHKRSH